MKGRDDTTKPTLKKSSTLYEISGPSFKNLQNLEYLNKQVYTHVHAQSKEWEVVSNSEALPYLPNRQNLVDITVGIQKQQEIETPLFGSIKLDDYLKYGKGYILNTGGSIWGLDFAPKVPALDSDPTMDYLAVAGYKGTVDECIPMTHVQEKGSYRNCIQIWKLHLSVQKHSVAPVLDLCLLHDYGVIYDLKWCPYGCYDEEIGDGSDGMPKLGILSFSCGDGSVRTVVVPHPKVVRKSMADVDESTTVFLKIKSARCVFSLGKSFVLGWGGHETLAVGCVDGTLALWNMVHALRTNQALDVQDTKKCMKIAIEIFRSSIVLLEWERETNRYLVLGGVDGDCRIVDIQDPFLHTRLTKNRTIKPVGAWSSNNFAFVTTESESHLKIYSFAENNVPSGSFIGESIGECNMIASSIFHPHIAYCSSIGWVMHVNTSPTKDRKWGTIMNVAYKLDYDEENDKYTYIDGVNHMTVDQAKELSGLEDFLSSSRSIQRITWCPTVRSAAFLASGGAAGLCRIEFVGCGTQWT